MVSTKLVALWPFWMIEKLVLIAFLAISDQYATFKFFFRKMTHGGHFKLPKITFDRISRHFRSIHNFYFLNVSQNARRQPFLMIENHFRLHFSPFQINAQLQFVLILQNGRRRSFWIDRISLSITFSPFL